MKIGMDSGADDESHTLTVAVIDGPYDAAALSGVLASVPLSLAHGWCDVRPNSACDHGTFIIGLLGAREDAPIPGLCPDCRLVHIPIFVESDSPSASVDDLATAIAQAVAAGARLINLSLAILGAESQVDHRLAAALDLAQASGALLVVAAGNQGRLAIGQLLSHPAVIPVAAVDASQRLLPDSNFGPAISLRGVAALGQMPGYAPGGGTTVMSGTSVAAAVATGTLAQAWSAHPEIDAATLRFAVAGLGPRNGSKPPVLNRDFVLAALDRMARSAHTATRAVEMPSFASLQGATTMPDENRQPRSGEGAGWIAKAPQTVSPAGSGCGCGAPGGTCTCQGGHANMSGFVYAIGTIEAEYPNVAIEREMQILAHHMGVEVDADRDLRMKPTEDRRWQYEVLSRDRKLTRYLARQLRWRLTIEDLPIFVINPADPSYFDDLIDALNRPKYSKPERPSGKRSKAAAAEPAFLDPVLDLDVVVGLAGPDTPDGASVVADQIYQVDPDKLFPSRLAYFSQLADNHGLSDEDRAYNFLLARYPHPLNFPVAGSELVGVTMTASRLGNGLGRIVRAIYTFRNAETTDERRYFARVDVTHEFPSIVTPLTPYVERGDRS